MAYDREYLKVNWLYEVLNSDEIASTGCNFSNAASTTFDAEAALAELVPATIGANLFGRMVTLRSNASMQTANYSNLVAVRIAAMSTAGLELAAPVLYVPTPPSLGTNADVIPQASIVLSLRSNVFGPGGNYGRMYLPHCQFAFATGEAVADPGDVSAIATAADTFIEGCNTDLNAQVTPTVSAMIMTNVSTPTQRESRRVNQIAIGDVTDTQRRRRNQIPETYTFRTIA
jgi:hypothetical protein